MATDFTEKLVHVGGNQVHMLTGGSGDPLVVFHGAGGNSGWLRYVQALADNYTVYLPTHPGYWQSTRPEWMETIHDLASFYTWFLEEQGLEGARAIGFSMGGWLASEIAVSCRHAFSKLMLVDAVGIKPQQGEIADIFIISPAQVTELLFHDPKQAPEYDQIYGQPRRRSRRRLPRATERWPCACAGSPTCTIPGCPDFWGGSISPPGSCGGVRTAWCRWNAASFTIKRYLSPTW